jgi:hypothetical protein
MKGEKVIRRMKGGEKKEFIDSGQTDIWGDPICYGDVLILKNDGKFYPLTNVEKKNIDRNEIICDECFYYKMVPYSKISVLALIK